MDEDEDEDMPLLPKSRRRLLSQGHDDEMSPPPLTSRRKGAFQATQTPTPSQAPPRRATQRQLRETSVNSDTSSIGTASRSRTRAAPAATQKKGRTEPIVIEESEDEVNRDLGPARSSTGTGTRGKSTRGTGPGTGSGIVGDDEASTATATVTRGRATQSSLGTGRRRLVVDDDDDGELACLLSSRYCRG
jgi:hypothetical protein